MSTGLPTLTAADRELLARIDAGDVTYRLDILLRCSYRLHPESRLVTPQCRRFFNAGLTARHPAGVYAAARGGTVALTDLGRAALTEGASDAR